LVVKIPVLLVVSLVFAIGGSLFVSGLFPAIAPDSAIHGHGNVPRAEAAELPLHVIERFTEKTMAGDAETGSSLEIDEEFVDPENHCEFCTRVEYVPGSRGIAGFAYGSDNPVDLTGAKKVRFWVMGEDGGEKVKFKIGGKQDAPGDRARNVTSSIFDNERFARSSDEVSLRDEWTKFEINLDGTDLGEITHPFGLEIAKGSGERSQVVYIKGIVIDDETIDSESELATTADEIEESAEEDISVEISSDETTGDTSASFRLRASVSGGDEPYTYAWDFDDGEEDTGRTIRHSFDEPGTFNVTVVVSDDAGRQATGNIEIEISEESEDTEESEEEVTEEENEDVASEGNSTQSQRSQTSDNSTAEE
jgi:hypothetical protein